MKKEIDYLTKELYPTGRAWNMINDEYHERLHRSLNKSHVRAVDDSLALLNHILPDNDNFLEDDAYIWEKRLGLISNPLTSLSDRKLAILRKLNYPGDIKARQSPDFLEGQLQLAGFDVYVHENIPATSMYDTFIANNPNQLGNNQLGNTNLGQNIGGHYSLFEVYQLNNSQLGKRSLNNRLFINKVANNVDEQRDKYYPDLDTFERTFIIGGVVKGDFANVPIARKDEFRELILKIKPLQSVAYLLINYV